MDVPSRGIRARRQSMGADPAALSEILQQMKFRSGLEQLDTKGKFVIRPESRFLQYWEVALLIAVLWASVSGPFRVAFFFNTLEPEASSIVADSFTWLIYVTDIFMSCRRGFIDSDGALVLNPNIILHRYLRSSKFVVDVISALPLDFVFLIAGMIKVSSFLRNSRLLRLSVLTDIIGNLERSPYINVTLIRVAKLVAYVVLMSHFIGCIWFSFSLIDGFGTSLWVPPEFLEDASMTTKYVHAFFWAMGMMSGNFDDAVPVTIMQHVFTVIVLFIGLLAFAYIIGNVQAVINNASEAVILQHRRLDYVSKFMKLYAVPKHLQYRVIQYYMYDWRMTGGFDESSILTDLRGSVRKDLQVELSEKTLKTITLFHGLSKKFVHELATRLKPRIVIPLEYLCHQGGEGHEMFLIRKGRISILINIKIKVTAAEIAKRKAEAERMRNEEGKKVNKLLVAKQGAVLSRAKRRQRIGVHQSSNEEEEVSKEDEGKEEFKMVEKQVGELGPGDALGEYSLLDPTRPKRSASARALTYCDIFTLHRDDIMSLMEYFPRDGNIIVNRTKAKAKKTTSINTWAENATRADMEDNKQGPQSGGNQLMTIRSTDMKSSGGGSKGRRRAAARPMRFARGGPEKGSLARSSDEKTAGADSPMLNFLTSGDTFSGRRRAAVPRRTSLMRHDPADVREIELTLVPYEPPAAPPRPPRNTSIFMQSKSKEKDASKQTKLFQTIKVVGGQTVVDGMVVGSSDWFGSKGSGISSLVTSDKAPPKNGGSVVALRLRCRTMGSCCTYLRDWLCCAPCRKSTDENDEYSEVEVVDTDDSKLSRQVSNPVELEEPMNTNRICTSYGCLIPEIINTTSRFYFSWSWILAFISLYNSILVPLRLAYWDHSEYALLILDAFTDVFLLLNFLIAFRVVNDNVINEDLDAAMSSTVAPKKSGDSAFDDDDAELDPREELVYLRFRRIARQVRRQYLCYRLWFDILTWLPIDWVVAFMFASSSKDILYVSAAFRINKMLRVFTDFFKSKGSTFGASARSYAYGKLLRLFGLFFVVLHWLGCVYWMFTSSEGFFDEEPDDEGWLPPVMYEDASLPLQYLRGAYHPLTLLTSLGKTVTPVTVEEVWYDLIVVLIGIFVVAYSIGEIGEIIRSMNLDAKNYKQRVLHANDFMRHRGIPAELQTRVRFAYAHQWQLSKGLEMEKALDGLPTGLRTEILLAITEDSIRSVSLFKQAEESVVLGAIRYIHFESYPPAEDIYRAGDIGDKFYIVSKGEVEIMEKSGNSLKVLHKGESFGEDCLFTAGTRNTGVRAYTSCQLLVLKKQDFDNLLSAHPNFKAYVQRFAQKRQDDLERLSYMVSKVFSKSDGGGGSRRRSVEMHLPLGLKGGGERRKLPLSSYPLAQRRQIAYARLRRCVRAWKLKNSMKKLVLQRRAKNIIRRYVRVFRMRRKLRQLSSPEAQAELIRNPNFVQYAEGLLTRQEKHAAVVRAAQWKFYYKRIRHETKAPGMEQKEGASELDSNAWVPAPPVIRTPEGDASQAPVQEKASPSSTDAAILSPRSLVADVPRGPLSPTDTQNEPVSQRLTGRRVLLHNLNDARSSRSPSKRSSRSSMYEEEKKEDGDYEYEKQSSPDSIDANDSTYSDDTVFGSASDNFSDDSTSDVFEDSSAAVPSDTAPSESAEAVAKLVRARVPRRRRPSASNDSFELVGYPDLRMRRDGSVTVSPRPETIRRAIGAAQGRSSLNASVPADLTDRCAEDVLTVCDDSPSPAEDSQGMPRIRGLRSTLNVLQDSVPGSSSDSERLPSDDSRSRKLFPPTVLQRSVYGAPTIPAVASVLNARQIGLPDTVNTSSRLLSLSPIVRRMEEDKAAEEKAKRDAEAEARRQLEEQARIEAEAKIRKEAEEKARRDAEEKALRDAEEKVRRDAEEKARKDAEEQMRREAAEAQAKQAEQETPALEEAGASEAAGQSSPPEVPPGAVSQSSEGGATGDDVEVLPDVPPDGEMAGDPGSVPPGSDRKEGDDVQDDENATPGEETSSPGVRIIPSPVGDLRVPIRGIWKRSRYKPDPL